MSSVGPAAQRMTLEDPSPVPFSKKDWKDLRVLASSIHDCCCCSLHILRACLSCKTNARKRKGTLGWFHFDRRKGRLEALRTEKALAWNPTKYPVIKTLLEEDFPCAQLIDTSMNRTSVAKERVPHSTEVDELKKMYGSQTIDQWLQIGDSNCSIINVARLEAIHGYCTGIAIDFLKQYFQARRGGKSSIEAVESISSRYSNGPPKEAQIIQIFHTALKMTKSYSKEWNEKYALWLEEYKQEVKKGPAETCVQSPDPLSEEEIKLGQIMSKRWTDLLLEQSLHQLELILQKVGLDCSGSKTIVVYEDGVSKSWIDFITDLTPGAYLVQLHLVGNGLGHAIALIKLNQNKYVIIEPNLGTFKIEGVGKTSIFLSAIQENCLLTIHQKLCQRNRPHTHWKALTFHSIELLPH